MVAVVGLGEVDRRIAGELGHRVTDAGARRQLEQLGATQLQSSGAQGVDRCTARGALGGAGAGLVADDDLAELEQRVVGVRRRRNGERAHDTRNNPDPANRPASLPSEA